MKIHFLILLICSSFLYGQETQKPQKDGAVKFVFFDKKKSYDFYFNCTITYDITQKVNFFVMGGGDSPIIKIKPGIHTFYIKMVLRTLEYKDVIISDVEVLSDRMTYLNIEVTPKEQKTEKDTIKIKWQKPIMDKDYIQQ
jgi:hypothetical protein